MPVSPLGVKEIRELAREIVLAHPQGIRYKDIVAAIFAKHPDATNRTTIEAQVANYLVPAYSGEIAKPSQCTLRMNCRLAACFSGPRPHDDHGRPPTQPSS
jgi:hypothetical protein